MVATQEISSIIEQTPLSKGAVVGRESEINGSQLWDFDDITEVNTPEKLHYYTNKLDAMVGMLVHYRVQHHLSAIPNETAPDKDVYMPKFIAHLNHSGDFGRLLGDEINTTIDSIAQNIALSIKVEKFEGYSEPLFLAEVPFAGDRPEILDFILRKGSESNLTSINEFLSENTPFKTVDELALAIIHDENFRLNTKNLRTLLDESVEPFDRSNPGSSLEQIRHLVAALSNYTHLDFKDNPPKTLEDIDKKLREVIITTSVKPDLLSFRVKENDNEADTVLKNFQLAIAGTLFGYTKLGDYRAMLGRTLPDETVAIDAILSLRRLVQEGRILMHLHEIKVDSTIKLPGLQELFLQRLDTISDRSRRDIAYTIFGINNYFDAVARFKDEPHKLELIKQQEGYEESGNQDDSHLPMSASLINVALPLVDYEATQFKRTRGIAWRQRIKNTPSSMHFRLVNVPPKVLESSINEVKERVILLNAQKRTYSRYSLAELKTMAKILKLKGELDERHKAKLDAYLEAERMKFVEKDDLPF